MKKNNKLKLSTLLFSFIILMSNISFDTYAAVFTSENNINKTINEYEALKNINQEYTMLKSRGLLENSQFSDMDSETIDSIINYKEIYSDKIYQLKKLSLEDLKEFNYSDSQIDAIKSFDGSEEKLMLASSSCTIYGDFNSFNPSYSGTTAELIMGFNWQGVPSNLCKDIFAVTWSSPFNCVSAEGYVTYKRPDYNTKTIYIQPEAGGLYGSSIKFLKYHDEGPNKVGYVQSGSMILNLKSNTYVADITGYAEYGYSSITIEPSVSFGGDLSISFSGNTRVLDTHRCYR